MPPRPRVLETPRPFLKWAGGKTQLLPEILKHLPEEIPFYIEPFVGGGAVFFALVRAGRVRQARLADRNPALVEVWQRVRDDVERVIIAARQWDPDKATYYAVRALDPDTLSAVDRAARILWLNRHCYNGLYRLNRSGRFNVPFGRYARPQTIDEDNLRRCSEALQGVEILAGDFGQVLDHIEEDAVVYLDPPYAPVSATSKFNAYDGLFFTTDDQERLARHFVTLTDRGARCALLSNSCTPFTEGLYTGLGVGQFKVLARRSINSKAGGRAPINELLVKVARP